MINIPTKDTKVYRRNYMFLKNENNNNKIQKWFTYKT